MAVRNLTSFELAGNAVDFEPIKLDQHTALPFISGSPSLVSLSLSDCIFQDRTKLSQVTPVGLPELDSLRLTGVYGPSGFSRLVKSPGLKEVSSLRILARKSRFLLDSTNYLIHPESDDGSSQLSYGTYDFYKVESGWLDLFYDVDLGWPPFVSGGGNFIRGGNLK